MIPYSPSVRPVGEKENAEQTRLPRKQGEVRRGDREVLGEFPAHKTNK